jgi:predicted transcriptional regulator of viral defense system
MNLKQLYYFKRLSETEHYTEAASSLCITQPSLSHAISELEKELGSRYSPDRAERQNYAKRQAFSAVCRRCAGLAGEWPHDVAKKWRENKENIRIAFIYTMGEYVVPQLINKYSLSPLVTM